MHDTQVEEDETICVALFWPASRLHWCWFTIDAHSFRIPSGHRDYIPSRLDNVPQWDQYRKCEQTLHTKTRIPFYSSLMPPDCLGLMWYLMGSPCDEHTESNKSFLHEYLVLILIFSLMNNKKYRVTIDWDDASELYFINACTLLALKYGIGTK